MIVRVGLPYADDGVLADAARDLRAPVLVSARSCWRPGRGFARPGRAAWTLPDVSLDSAGFTAQLLGGYPWTVEEYVRFVATNGGAVDRPVPWTWWAAMDFCVEPQIASTRAEVERRMDRTVDTFDRTLELVDATGGLPDPMPTIQGWRPSDYVRCALDLASVCRGGRLPPLVGVGSVCRRALHGPDGLLAVLDVLHQALDPDVRLHLFGVKGALLPRLAEYGTRVASTDSMAWDLRAKHACKEAGVRFTVDRRAAELRRWYAHQQDALAAGPDPGDAQLPLL